MNPIADMVNSPLIVIYDPYYNRKAEKGQEENCLTRTKTCQTHKMCCKQNPLWALSRPRPSKFRREFYA